jgi:hypothetical protein
VKKRPSDWGLPQLRRLESETRDQYRHRIRPILKDIADEFVLEFGIGSEIIPLDSFKTM